MKDIAQEKSTIYKSLFEYAIFHQTDKNCNHHNYIKYYKSYFEKERNNFRKILEIGIGTGASHRMWADYFPKAIIFGIDIHDATKYDQHNITTFVGDQSSRDDLQAFILKHGKGFDIIIDDGGHTARQQQASLGYLFKYLSPNGIYVIEDLHTSPETKGKYFGNNCYGQKVIENKEMSTLSVLQQISDAKYDFLQTANTHLFPQEIEYLCENILSCDIHLARLSEIAFIIKEEHSNKGDKNEQ